ncbi:MAG: class I SAM-dependent methyltransferase [Nitrososphaeraceae archaeon]
MKKLHLGCGYNKLPGWINVDSDNECNPDLCFDLRDSDWPIEDSTIEEVLAEHILEHIETTEGYLTLWKELYRVCKPNAIIRIEVPHWKHDTFIHDPTHVRAVTPVGIAMFDQQRNENDRINNGRETKLGFMCGIDFELNTVHYGFDTINGEPMVCYYQVQTIKPPRYKSKNG